jgi:hypothetical protein
MKKRKAEEKGEIYLLKVTLSDWSGRVRGMPYRILTIPEGFTLYELAESITDAFDFDFDHSFGFYDNIKSWTDSVERYESSTGGLTRSILFALLFPPGELEDKRNVARTKVNEVFDDPCKKLLFLYDYGDEWHFIVQLKETRAPEKDTKYPQIVESVGKAPPQYGDEEEEK